MRKKRQGLTESVSPDKLVSPTLDRVSPQEDVSPVRPQPTPAVRPCQLNHYSFSELFHQATQKIKQDYRVIYKDSETSRKCFDCHNRERNYQIMLNLLERYWKEAKKSERRNI